MVKRRLIYTDEQGWVYLFFGVQQQQQQQQFTALQQYSPRRRELRVSGRLLRSEGYHFASITSGSLQ